MLRSLELLSGCLLQLFYSLKSPVMVFLFLSALPVIMTAGTRCSQKSRSVSVQSSLEEGSFREGVRSGFWWWAEFAGIGGIQGSEMAGGDGSGGGEGSETCRWHYFSGECPVWQTSCEFGTSLPTTLLELLLRSSRQGIYRIVSSLPILAVWRWFPRPLNSFYRRDSSTGLLLVSDLEW